MAIALGCVLLAGCNAPLIQGVVVDVKGDTLPGVAVSVAGGESDRLTDVQGRYRIGYRPGTVRLSYIKTGYTSGQLELEIDGYRPVQATPIALWPLPWDPGVYLFENYRYRATQRVVPERWSSADGGVVCGTARWSDVETPQTGPLLLCYRMPKQGLALSRLDLVEVTAPMVQSGARTVDVWAPVQAIPVVPQPADAPEGLLVKVGLPGPLEPGCYAVHWGALDREPPLEEPRIFLFNVGEVPVPVPAAEGTAPQTEPPPPPTERTETSNDSGGY